MEKQKRKISKFDRKVWRRNALLGTKEWMEETPEERRKARERREYSAWGFKGHSPHTKDIRHVHVRAHRKHRNGKEYRVREHYRYIGE